MKLFLPPRFLFALGCIALSAHAMAGLVTPADYTAERARIAGSYASDRETCTTLNGNAKSICMQCAKGRSKVAQASLIARDDPSTKHSYQLSMAQADAAYVVADEKCDDLNDNPKDVCRKEAKQAYVIAKADALVVEKSANAAYAVAKEKCDALPWRQAFFWANWCACAPEQTAP